MRRQLLRPRAARNRLTVSYKPVIYAVGAPRRPHSRYPTFSLNPEKSTLGETTKGREEREREREGRRGRNSPLITRSCKLTRKSFTVLLLLSFFAGNVTEGENPAPEFVEESMIEKNPNIGFYAAPASPSLFLPVVYSYIIFSWVGSFQITLADELAAEELARARARNLQNFRRSNVRSLQRGLSPLARI